MLPPIYRDASVRAVLPVCQESGRLGVAFDVVGLPAMRFALDRDSAEFLRKGLEGYLATGGPAAVDAKEVAHG